MIINYTYQLFFIRKKTSNYSNYKLIITGHSLGAGAAILLALTFRSLFPDLHCYAYGTPGSVLDKQSSKGTQTFRIMLAPYLHWTFYEYRCSFYSITTLAHHLLISKRNNCFVCWHILEFSSFITSVVISNDMVSRLSLPKLCKLRHDVLEAISRAKVNKMLIMQALFRDFEIEVTIGCNSHHTTSVSIFKMHTSYKVSVWVYILLLQILNCIFCLSPLSLRWWWVTNYWSGFDAS